MSTEGKDGKHHGAQRALDKVQDAAGAVVGQVSAALGGGADITFVRNAALSDLYAIEAAEFATRRAQSRPVRALADKLMSNHRTSLQLLYAALGRSDVNQEDELPPGKLDPRRESMIDHLMKAPDEHLDKTYLDQQLAAHDEAHTLFETYAKSGEDGHLRAHATSILPGIEAHTRSAAAILMKLEGDKTN